MLTPKRLRPSSSSSSSATGSSCHGHQEDCGGGHQQPLLPGLPDHLSQLCLARLPPTTLYSVCRPWRRLLYSPSFPPFLSLYAFLSSKKNTNLGLDLDRNRTDLGDLEEDDTIGFYSYDPIAGRWDPLPPPPSPLPRVIIRHPSFLSRSLPVQTLAASCHLVVAAATATRSLLPALPCPLAFHTLSRRWLLGPPLPHPRRWCAAGSVAGAAFVASGAGSHYSPVVARSAHRWDPLKPYREWDWEPMALIPHPRFSREPVEAVTTTTYSKGMKLCMVNLRGRGAKEGLVYDLRSDTWEEMPTGLLAGWTGPAAAEESKENGHIYVADEGSGELREYHWERDKWAVVAPASEQLRGATQMAAEGGRVCIAREDGAVTVVDVASERRGRMWTVEPPPGMRVIAVHVLTRMPLDDDP